MVLGTVQKLGAYVQVSQELLEDSKWTGLCLEYALSSPQHRQEIRKQMLREGLIPPSYSSRDDWVEALAVKPLTKMAAKQNRGRRRRDDDDWE